METEESTIDSALFHHIGGYVNMTRIDILEGEGVDFEEFKRGFREKLEGILRDTTLKADRVTRDDIRTFIGIVSDRSYPPIETLKRIYRKENELTGEPYNEKELFPTDSSS